MKTLSTLTAAVALLAGAGAAQAADVYSNGSTKDPVTGVPASTVNWGGLYGGVNLGYGWGDRNATDVSFYDLDGKLTEANKDAFASHSVGGVVGGGQLGYLFQKGNIVGGLEVSFNGSGITGSKSATDITKDDGSVTTDKAKISQTINWYGTVGPRLGFAIDHVLISGTGGFAYGSVTDKFTHSESAVDAHGDVIADAAYSESWKAEGVRTGYFVGADIEYKVNNWGVFVGYQHVDLGSRGIKGTIYTRDTPAEAVGAIATSSRSAEFDVVKVGINYHTN